MIQPPAPLPWRRAELEYLSRALGIAPIFGGEVTEMTQHIMEDMADTSKP